MENIAGKKALVTGGSRGLGKATAIALAKEGVHVAITGRNEAIPALLMTISNVPNDVFNFSISC